MAEAVPKFVFIAGTPRSGGSVTLGSLDGHPDILAWPFEFNYFPFFRRLAGKRATVPSAELNRGLEAEFRQYFSKRLRHGRGVYDQNSKALLPEGEFNLSDFDYQLFRRNLEKMETKEVAATAYLLTIFACLKSACRSYRDRAVTYYLIFTTARGYDWDDERLFSSSLVLFSYRDAEDSYASLREKYLEQKTLPAFFDLRGKKSFIYWLETYRRISRYAESRSGAKNFLTVPLKSLQKDSASVLKEICAFLRIEPHPVIGSLTIFGSPYKGNANESGLNQGQIAKRTSNTKTPLSSFERRMFASLDLFDFAAAQKRERISFGPLVMLKVAFGSAFSELPADKMVGKEGGVASAALGRMSVFLRLCSNYLTFKSNRLTQKSIRKGNRHVFDIPLWEQLSLP